MEKKDFYSSGEFAHMAHVTLRTIRYYDKKNILKPSFVSEKGARFYTDADLVRLQQILLLKYLGFSLNDIWEMTIKDTDYHHMANSLQIQLKLVRERIEQMQLVEKAIIETTDALNSQQDINWSNLLDLIHLTGMENSLKIQYQNSENISSRINLHKLYSQNITGWFSWIYAQCNIRDCMNIMEIGCGDGTFWKENLDNLPTHVHINISDISDGMLRDARHLIGTDDARFEYQALNCQNIPFPDHTFDLVIANHVLFYCDDIPKACNEIFRVLNPGGTFICSTYGEKHMNEINTLVTSFDDRIKLSAEKLYDKFGLENGIHYLQPLFSSVTINKYEDSLLVTDAEPLISYIFSCHGNQNQYLINRYQEFHSYVEKKTADGFYISKDAGIFICHKN